METRRGTPPAPFISRPIPVFLATGALAAAATAWLVWSWFPYERLERFSLEEKLLAWEDIVWLLALSLGLLGLACVLQVTGLRVREGAAELRRRLRDARTSEARLLAVAGALPWWMIGYAVSLVVVASAVRALVAP
jgi:hypothetical protein